MNRRTKIIVSVVGIFIVLLALVGITYAYFLTQVQGNTNDTSISITTANLRLVYEDGQNIEAQNIQPGDTIYTKTFTVKNEGNASIDYEVYLENVINNFIHEEDLLMFVTCTSNIAGNTCNGYGNGSVSGNTPTFGTSLYPQTNSLLIQNSIAPANGSVDAEVHTYTLYLKFKDDNSDQSDDMGKTLQGKVQIYDPKDVVAISGTVTGYDSSYYLELHSDTKTSEIASDGSYIFYGVGAEEHTLYVMKRNSDGTTSEIGSKTIDVTKGNEASVNSDASNIVIDNNTLNIEMDITLTKDGNTTNITTIAGGINLITLRDAILRDNIAKSDTNVDFSKETTQVGLYYTNVNTQNNDTTYYFRGAVGNNYVVFGNNESDAGMCLSPSNGYGTLPVIDRNGHYISSKEECISGSVYVHPVNVEMIVAGFESVEACTEYYTDILLDGEVPEGEEWEGWGCEEINGNQGWIDGILWRIVRINEDGSIRLNLFEHDSSMPDFCESGEISRDASVPIDTTSCLGSSLNEWYNTYLSSYSSMLSDTGFCTYSTSTVKDGITYYDPYTRLTADSPRPQFGCTNRFTKETGGFDGPIGLITVDELVYAGYDPIADSYNAYSNALYQSYWFGVFTLSPAYNGTETNRGFWAANGLFLASDASGVAVPVINLNMNVEIKSGDGTIGNPYIIN